jgi:hypothetical protein
MSNDKMITFKLITYENELRFGVTIPAIEAEIEREYEQDEAKDIIRKFHDMMLGNTVSKVNDEIAIYPNDIAAIFERLEISIMFINDNGSELAINANGSGIMATRGTAAGILKNIQTNNKFSEDDSLQSAVDEPED